jgi:hypothetical protein
MIKGIAMKKIIFLCIFVLFLCGSATAAPVEMPKEPPIQVSEIEIVDGYTTIGWDANIEEDLQDYVFGFSIDKEGDVDNTGEYTFGKCPTCFFTVGNVTSIQIADLPVYDTIAVEGDTVYFVLHARDTVGNISEASEEISISFFVKPPPNAPQGVMKK